MCTKRTGLRGVEGVVGLIVGRFESLKVGKLESWKV
jgi:hypothetical protein